MQNAKAFIGIEQVTLSLGPVPQGEIASIIREPAEIRRRKVGPDAPVFDAAAVERLQAEIEGEPDALPLLAFVLQRLMREHAGESVIGLSQINQSGGLTEAKSRKLPPHLAMPAMRTVAATVARICGNCSCHPSYA